MLSFDKIIIDEGQDFPPDFFRLLRLLSEGVLGREGKQLSVMVLADENQRLSKEQHSTISDIEAALAIPATRHYRLRTNFRNTRQVALVSQHFFAGASTGVPKLPERQGPTPEMRRSESLQAAVEQIVIYQRNNPKHEIGVLIPDDDPARRDYFEALRKAVPSSARVQTYAFRDPNFNTPKRDLVFDEPSLTVLNRASCKGLEFDAVFIVNIHKVRIEEGQEEFFKMGMYVMSARARRSLVFLWIGRPSDRPNVLGLMPEAPAIRISA
jgi:superfamily I DNA/RNA helicase